MTKRPAIRFVGDFVHKWYPEAVDLEFEKGRLLWEVSQQSGFLCPEPLELRSEDRVIVYRHLRSHGKWESIRSAYLDCMVGSVPAKSAVDAIAEAGRVLGAIHTNLALPTPTAWWPSAEILASLERVGAGNGECEALPPVCLHGDYGFSNVLWSRDLKMIATLDPSPDGYSTFAPNLRGPAYVDLGQFVSCVEGRIPLKWYPRVKWKRLAEMRRTFLDGYERATGYEVDRDCVRRFGFAIAEANFRDRLSYGPGPILARKVLYNRIKGNAL